MSDLLKQVDQPQSQSTRQIPLTQGQFAIVDAADYAWLMQWKWFARYDTRGKRFYAMTQGKYFGQRRSVAMHRILLNVNDPKVHIDHRDGDSLNNTRENLRHATPQQNQANRHKQKNNTTGFRGVRFKKEKKYTKPWQARIGINCRVAHIGFFATAKEAALAYDQKAIEVYGDFAQLNFPTAKNPEN